MKRTSIFRKLAVITGCVALMCVFDVGVGNAATATTTTTGIVVVPMTITKTLDLNFGKFVSGGTTGTVIIGTDNSQTVTGGVTSTTGFGATAKAATFTVTGQASTTYAITYPAQTTLTGAGTAMTIGTFTNAVDTGTVLAGVGTLPAGGSHVLSVGATLDVGAGQTAGTYSGTLDVAVNYN